MKKQNLSVYVSGIIEDIKKGGDKAVFKYLKKFDGIDLSKQGLRVSKSEIDAGVKRVSAALKRAIKSSYLNVLSFHKTEFSNIKKSWGITRNGVKTGQFYTCIESAGLYVPGGLYPYPSTVIMTAVAAKAAGVKRIVMVTPPNRLSDELLYAAKLCGVSEIYRVGGIMAVAALAYGTKNIEKVDIIVGPGNAYVNEAKRQVFGAVGIDSLAGPSEVAIIADKNAPAEFIFADLMAQVEHGNNANAYLFCDSKEKIEQVKKLLPKDALNLVRLGFCSLDEAVKKVNEIAPEHLELLVKNYKPLFKKVKNAGAVFAGYQTPTAAGDYWAGPSHVLPTNASAKYSSGLSVMTFLKRTSYTVMNKNNKKGFKEIASFAAAEGMKYHKKSAEVRI
ncbi:histidinol dehydrogenase [Endomicrobium proavitum]|uniref:Histidinol dehydrogenase n=1 Tax=Endomicrobium proavitum TaxID=1408281 RepID=A0A0G3WHJ4_9BACT|nr:histidinol dehydrogenase [Endomicrobium proavitum]AKL97798.1 Histidinol dehydrogenase [Endomicrobium proavitum]